MVGNEEKVVKELVLGCVQSWLNRFGRDDIIKMVSDDFLDKEIFEGLKSLCDCLAIAAPKNRYDTKKQVAVKVWAAEIYDTMMKEDNADKLPEFVVSSQDLQRVPLALMSGANDVIPICTRMTTLEKKVEEMVDTMTKFTKGQLMSALQIPAPGPGYSGSYASAVSGITPSAAPLTPSRGRIGSFAGAAAAVKRKHEESFRPRSQAGANSVPDEQQVGILGGQLGGQPGVAGVLVHGQGQRDGQGQRQGAGQRQPRKQCYGASKVVATGRTDWAAPVDVFVSNTSPDISEDDVKEILKLCAEDVRNSEGQNELEEFIVKDVKCMTRNDIENPRTKCWRVSVPFKFKEYILSDLAYPMGWCHRPFYPPKQKPKDENEADQIAKRNRLGNSM